MPGRHQNQRIRSAQFTAQSTHHSTIIVVDVVINPTRVGGGGGRDRTLCDCDNDVFRRSSPSLCILSERSLLQGVHTIPEPK